MSTIKCNPTDPQDLKRNILPIDMGFPATNHDEGILKSSLLPKDFEFLMEDSEDDLKYLNDEEVFDAGDKIETDLPYDTEEHYQPPSSTHKKHKKARKPKESEPSPDPSGSESSLVSLSFNDYDNYMPITKRVLAKNLKGFFEARIEAFKDEAYKAQGNTNASLKNYEKIMLTFKEQHLKGINTILTNLYTVEEAEVIKTYQQSSNNLLSLVELLREANVPESIKSDIALLKTDTADIKAMVIEIFCAFKGQTFSTPSGIFDNPFIPSLEKSPERQTMEEKETPYQPKGEQVDMVTKEAKSEEPKEAKVLEQEHQVIQSGPIQTIIPTTTPIITKVITPRTTITLTEATPITEVSGSLVITPRVDKSKGITIETDPSTPKHVKASRKVHMNPNAPTY
ncbi:hypothetical protein Tco_0675526 [Tanacetum coccineum]